MIRRIKPVQPLEGGVMGHIDKVVYNPGNFLGILAFFELTVIPGKKLIGTFAS